jgi:hypothetical protein
VLLYRSEFSNQRQYFGCTCSRGCSNFAVVRRSHRCNLDHDGTDRGHWELVDGYSRVQSFHNPSRQQPVFLNLKSGVRLSPAPRLLLIQFHQVDVSRQNSKHALKWCSVIKVSYFLPAGPFALMMYFADGKQNNGDSGPMFSSRQRAHLAGTASIAPPLAGSDLGDQ